MAGSNMSPERSYWVKNLKLQGERTTDFAPQFRALTDADKADLDAAARVEMSITEQVAA